MVLKHKSQTELPDTLHIQVATHFAIQLRISSNSYCLSLPGLMLPTCAMQLLLDVHYSMCTHNCEHTTVYTIDSRFPCTTECLVIKQVKEK